MLDVTLPAFGARPSRASDLEGRTEPFGPAFLARCAVRALHAELVLYPKPGLVSLRDSGAHDDMDASTFARSLFALRHYFRAIGAAGARREPLAGLRRLGLDAERRMLGATGGINVHRGAIFALGLLCAAAAASRRTRESVGDAAIVGALGSIWGPALAVRQAAGAEPPSHGELVARRFGAPGARGEAAGGFPSVFGVALPALRTALARGAAAREAQVHALFALLANVTDTNVLYRAGADGAAFLRSEAQIFLDRGGVFADGWHARAERLHRDCVARRISPGGCADLLAAALFVDSLQRTAR